MDQDQYSQQSTEMDFQVQNQNQLLQERIKYFVEIDSYHSILGNNFVNTYEFNKEPILKSDPIDMEECTARRRAALQLFTEYMNSAISQDKQPNQLEEFQVKLGHQVEPINLKSDDGMSNLSPDHSPVVQKQSLDQCKQGDAHDDDIEDPSVYPQLLINLDQGQTASNRDLDDIQ